MKWQLSRDTQPPEFDVISDEFAAGSRLSLRGMRSIQWSQVRHELRDPGHGSQIYSAWFASSLHRLPVRSERIATTALWNACRGIWRPPMR